jgi:acetyl-CoA carboxylase biotin carboxyl carrier protein
MASKEPRGKEEAVAFPLADVRALAKLVKQFELTELELERHDQRLRIRREPASAGPMLATQTSEHMPQLQVVPPAEAEPEPDADGSVTITSPFVGTFYKAPSPESSPFAEVGQTVKKGTVLCIVEAMKLMNEIESETDCKILEIIAKNAEVVEFGQPLFKVFPLA